MSFVLSLSAAALREELSEGGGGGGAGPGRLFQALVRDGSDRVAIASIGAAIIASGIDGRALFALKHAGLMKLGMSTLDATALYETLHSPAEGMATAARDARAKRLHFENAGARPVDHQLDFDLFPYWAIVDVDDTAIRSTPTRPNGPNVVDIEELGAIADLLDDPVSAPPLVLERWKLSRCRPRLLSVLKAARAAGAGIIIASLNGSELPRGLSEFLSVRSVLGAVP